MNLIEKIKQNENSPIYLAFTLGILTGTVVGFLASPIKKGMTIGSYNNIENNEGCGGKDEPKEKKKTKVTRPVSRNTTNHYKAPTIKDLIQAHVRDFK